jgi:protein tyrosine/serine phosphatase
MSVTDVDRPDLETPVSRTAGGKRWPLWVVLAVALIVVAGLALIAWNNGVKQYLYPKKFGVVEPGRIYRSGQISARLLGPTLGKYHIGMVIDLSMEDTPDSRAERQVETERNIRRLSLPLGGDGVGNPDYYVQALTAMIEADRSHTPVLVHCQAGTERTGGVVAAYRILVEGKPEDLAFAEARSYGHSDRDNPQLVPFVKEHLQQWRAALVAGHLIAN